MTTPAEGARRLLIAHAAATFFMTGVIWIVQLVHYPLFALVGLATFGAYETSNIARTAALVGPVMILEAATGLLLLRRPPAGVTVFRLRLGLALLAAAWVSTALFQFPAHQALRESFQGDVLTRLIVSNWVRTAAWTARGALVLVMLQDAR